MADETPKPPYNDNNAPEPSPSALFLEMMRQAALRDADSPEADEPDTLYIPEEDLFPEADPAPNDVHPQQFEEVSEPEPDPISEPIVEPEPEPDPIAEPKPEPEPTPIAQGRVPIYTAPDDDAIQDERAAKLEAQRVRRLRRRQERRQQRRVGVFGGFFRTALVVFIAATLSSTIFTWFTDPEFFTPDVVSGLQLAESTSVAAAVPLTPTTIDVTPNWARRIGIVSGHAGPEDDPGAVCDDGLTEREINFAVAQLVVRQLRELGYTVDLLDEFDPRLLGYQAAALVSIHANDCRDYGEYVSGYLVARASARPAGGRDDILAECVGREYEAVGIPRRFTLTLDMTDYHTFREIHQRTPAAILELGFMRDDRELLLNEQPLLAQQITSGILCFLNGENPIITGTEFPTVTPLPTGTP